MRDQVAHVRCLRTGEGDGMATGGNDVFNAADVQRRNIGADFDLERVAGR